MSLTTSSVTPLIIQVPKTQNDLNQIMIHNPNERYFDSPTSRTIRRTYFKPSKSKYHYTIEQVNLLYSFLFILSFLFNIEWKIVSLLSMVSLLVYT
jgi:hypothetical protein